MRAEIGSYRILQKLGEGAAGEVFLATPIEPKSFASPGQPVAIKVYKPTFLGDSGQLERIRREFKVGSTIHHPNLVRIFEAYVDAAEPYLVMEFVDGVPLSTWIGQFHPAAGRVVLALAEQLISAVETLHTNGIVHRDLKPANVMMTSSFEAKVMDFGVVHITTSTPITDPDRFVGTIRNAAPETLRGRGNDERSDLYSLGTILYALLYGEEVFADEKQFVRLADLIERTDPGFASGDGSRDQVCESLLDQTKRLLQKDPEKRPKSAAEVRQQVTDVSALLRFSSAPAPLHGYIATALTNLDRDAKGHITFASSKIAEVAKQHGFYVYQPRRATDPVLHKDFDADSVYALDRQKVVNADLLLVLVNKPSFGVGQELEIAASYSKPMILIREADVQVSRMVLGCPANVIAEIDYRTPEDLARRLHKVLPEAREKVLRWRAGVGNANERATLASRLKEARLQAGYDSPESLADVLGISVRVVKAIESGTYENVGHKLLERLAAALGVAPGSLLVSGQAPTNSSSVDANIRRLERIAQRAGWSASDYLKVRADYEHERAARGSQEAISDEEWLRRRQALERRALTSAPGETPHPSFF